LRSCTSAAQKQQRAKHNPTNAHSRVIAVRICRFALEIPPLRSHCASLSRARGVATGNVLAGRAEPTIVRGLKNIPVFLAYSCAFVGSGRRESCSLPTRTCTRLATLRRQKNHVILRAHARANRAEDKKPL
jgi:hypothetical protein